MFWMYYNTVIRNAKLDEDDYVEHERYAHELLKWNLK